MRRVDWKRWVGTAITVALGYLALPAQIDPRRVEHLMVAAAGAGHVSQVPSLLRDGRDLGDTP